MHKTTDLILEAKRYKITLKKVDIQIQVFRPQKQETLISFFVVNNN
jgi:hypothetical protein